MRRGLPGRGGGGAARAEAIGGVVRRESDLVPGRRLPREAELRIWLPLLVRHRTRGVGVERPGIGIVDVLVLVESRRVLGIHVVPRGEIKPDAVLQNRAAEPGI